MYQKRFYNVEVVKVFVNAYEFDNRVLSAMQLTKGKNIQDNKKFSQLRKVAAGRTHTGYLIFAKVCGEM